MSLNSLQVPKIYDFYTYKTLCKKQNLNKNEEELKQNLKIFFLKNTQTLLNLYKYSILSYAANVRFGKFITQTIEDKKEALFKALINKNFFGDKIPVGGFENEKLALNFAQNYEVLAHIKEGQKDSKMGFRASLFKGKDELILALAGSDFINPLMIDLGDFFTDFSLFCKKLPLGQYESMIHFYETHKSLIKDYKFIVVGHSLGGYLAQLFALTYPQKINACYTFQAPGAKEFWVFNPLKKKFFSKLQISEKSFDILSSKTFHIHTQHNANLKSFKWYKFNFVQKLYKKTPGFNFLFSVGTIKHHPSICVNALDELLSLLNLKE